MVYIGIDLGGTNIKAGIVDEQGKILTKVDCPSKVERGHEAVIADMAMLARKAVEKAGLTMDDVKCIGIGVPGILDPKTGVVPFCVNLGWHHVPLRELMRSHIDKPVFIDNDATVAGLAEYVAGISKGTQSSVFLTLGTGVGGGIVINGKVYSGAHGIGSELGHTIVKFDGDLCNCGNYGCWERYASASALIRMGKEAAEQRPDCMIARHVNGNLDRISAKTVIDCAKAGDETACAVFQRYAYYLAVGIVSIINSLDPEIIALGGGVSAAGDFLLNAVREEVAKLIFYKDMPYARIELATMGNDAGIVGAAMLGR
jgi:glucokinase